MSLYQTDPYWSILWAQLPGWLSTDYKEKLMDNVIAPKLLTTWEIHVGYFACGLFDHLHPVNQFTKAHTAGVRFLTEHERERMRVGWKVYYDIVQKLPDLPATHKLTVLVMDVPKKKTADEKKDR